MQNVHGIDLFKSATLSLDDEEINDSNGDEEACRKNITVSEVNVPNDEWGEES